MKKSIAVILALVLTLSSVFVACSNKDNGETTTTEEGLNASADEYGFQTVEVTDDNGKTVTDAKGNAVTTEVAVKYEVNKKGKTVAKVLDNQGNTVTDKKGNEVTVKTDYEVTTAATTKKSGDKTPTTKKQKTTASTTVPTKKGEATTQENLTTLPESKNKVPTTSDKGEAVTFSSADQQVLKNMLEVPYLYKASYENADGVPIEIASHAAIWMAEREGMSTSTFAAGTIVIDLFRYFGQTVVNFKSKCNSEGEDKNISYNSNNDTFTISNFENKQQTVSIEKIESLGNNNYYKVTASVSGAGKINKVVAVVQRNRLDSTLGFSIKALKWS